VREIDGHNLRQIEETLEGFPFEADKPSVIVAHTIKGKGIDYMENQLAWHYRAPNAELLEKALKQLEQ
jgi:transketolase